MIWRVFEGPRGTRAFHHWLQNLMRTKCGSHGFAALKIACRICGRESKINAQMDKDFFVISNIKWINKIIFSNMPEFGFRSHERKYHKRKLFHQSKFLIGWKTFLKTLNFLLIFNFHAGGYFTVLFHREFWSRVFQPSHKSRIQGTKS